MTYHPDFDCECSQCGTAPCVVVEDHLQPDTELCGTCFFGDRSMLDWDRWNDQPESTE